MPAADDRRGAARSKPAKRPAPKPRPKPTAKTKIAHAQERQYASQGRYVEHAANRQKVRKTKRYLEREYKKAQAAPKPVIVENERAKSPHRAIKMIDRIRVGADRHAIGKRTIFSDRETAQFSVQRLYGKHTSLAKKAEAADLLTAIGATPGGKARPLYVNRGKTSYVGSPRAIRPMKVQPVSRVDPDGKIKKGVLINDKFKVTHKANFDETVIKAVKGALTPVGVAAKGISALSHVGPKKLDTNAKVKVAGINVDANSSQGLNDALKKTVKSGAASAGGIVFEGFDRPVAAVESVVGKGLVKAGAIKGDTARKIKAAHGAGDVFLHGRDWDRDVTGGDITKGVTGSRVLGLPVDLALDPTMYAGIALAPETGGASLALVLEKIRRVAPELLHTERAAKALKAFETHHDEKRLVKDLRPLLSRASVRKAHAARSKQITEDALGEVKNATVHIKVPKRGKLVDKPFVIPAAGKEAVEQAMRSGEARRVAPKLRLHAMTPTGGRKTARGIPISPDLGKFPLYMSKRTREARFARAERDVRTRYAAEKDAALKEIDEKIAAARAAKNSKAVRTLAAQKREVRDAYITKVDDALVQARREVQPKTFGDVVASRNERQQLHSTRLAAAEYGRMVQHRVSDAVQDATRALGGSPADKKRSLERVQLFLETEAGTKGAAVGDLGHAINLTPEEQVVAQNLKSVQSGILTHAKQLGLLDEGLEGYVGMRIWNDLDNPERAITEELAGLRKTGSPTTAYQRHRVIPAVGDFASRDALASTIARLADEPMGKERALEIADRVWRQGSARSLSELTARRLERGNTVKWDDLTGIERQAVDHAARVGLDPSGEKPLFQLDHVPVDAENPAITEGHIVPANFEHYGLGKDMAELGDQTAPAQLLSAIMDRQQVQHMSQTADEAALPDLQQIEARLTEEIDRLAPGHVESPELTAATAQHEDRMALIGKNREEAEAQLDAPAEGPRMTIDEKAAASEGQDVTVHLATGEQVTGKNRGVDEFGHLRVGHEDVAPHDIVRFEGDFPSTNGANPDAARRIEQLDEQKGLAQADFEQVKQQLGADVPDGSKLATELDEDGNLWLRGPESHDTPPAEGMVPRGDEPGPFENPFDFTSRLPDFRASEGTGTMIELDPRVSGHKRARAAGLTSSFHVRWQAVDAARGRSVKDALERTFTHVDSGDVGFLRDLVVQRDEWGKVLGYEDRYGGQSFKPEDIHIDDQALVPNADKSIWLDPKTNIEYTSPIRYFEKDASLMLKGLPEDRVWPLRTLDDLKLDMARAGEFDNVWDSMYQDGLNHGVQKVLSMMRFSVTTPFPAYHVRNLISDLLKSMQADSGVLFHPIVNAKLTAAAFGKGKGLKIKIPGYGKMKVEDFLFTADMFGVKSGHHVAEVAQLMKQGEFSASRLKSHMRNSWFAPGGKSTKFGAAREDVARFMTFMQRMRSNGGDAADAAFYMTRHHFNYNDLTANERRYMRNLFLFYTWYRKNIPLQLTELARRPGFFAGVVHTYNSLQHGETPLNALPPFQGAAPDQPALPDYVKDKLGAATTSWNGFALNVGFGAPWNDLQWLSLSGLKDAATTLTAPPFTLAYQYASRQDPLTGRTFKDRETSGPAHLINLAYKAVTGHDLPKDENGNPTLPWALNVAVRQAPFAGRATYSLGDVPKGRDQGRLQTYGQGLSNVTGLNIFVSPKPGSAREKVAVNQYLSGLVGERRDKLMNLSNFDKTGKYYKDAVKAQDKQALELATQRGIQRALTTTKQSGYYKAKSRRKSYIGGGLSSSLNGGLP